MTTDKAARPVASVLDIPLPDCPKSIPGGSKFAPHQLRTLGFTLRVDRRSTGGGVIAGLRQRARRMNGNELPCKPAKLHERS